MKINRNSCWSKTEIDTFLDQSMIPMRLSFIDHDGYPVVCSLWFYYVGGVLWAASHKNAYLVRMLKKNPSVGFEISTNDIPYKGGRGKAGVELVKDKAEEVLTALIDRYLERNKMLAGWLLSRVEDEYAIKIKPTNFNAWDFSNRMNE